MKRTRADVAPLDLAGGKVELSHGSGGRAMAQLVEELFVAAFDSAPLHQQDDAACVEPPAGRLAISTDCHVVDPLFFPGGDIGSLAVHGTVNDVAMCGARPLYLTAGFILEEGLPLEILGRVVASMAGASGQAGVPVVAGDTKVVERGKGDKVFITTTGVGVVPDGLVVAGDRARPGDRVLLSGSIGDHGIAVLSARGDLALDAGVESDSVALHELVATMVTAAPDLHCLRDPTRGGLAAALNELARQSGVGMMVEETAIPVRQEVRAACELLGLDPLHVANEGKLVAICPGERADALLSAMREHPLGREAAVIGEVRDDPRCFVQLRTPFGGTRIVDWLTGEQLPRIC